MSLAESDVQRFRRRVERGRINEATSKKYLRWAQRFEHWLGEAQPGLEDLYDFDDYLADPERGGYPWGDGPGRPAPDEYAYRSRKVALSGVKLWLDIVYGVKIDEEVQYIVSGEPAPFDPDYLSENDVYGVISSADAACENKGCRAALMVSYDAILRAAELCRVRRQDVDLDAGTVYVRAVKDSQNAHISLSEETLNVLQRHMRAFPKREYLFYNSYGRPWKASAWCSHFADYHHEVGSHAFGRHSAIVNRLNAGEEFGEVYRRARHAHPNMTTRYARIIGADPPDWAKDA